MRDTIKTVDSLTTADLKAHAVWRHVNRDESGELLVEPAKRVPVSDLVSKIVGAQVRFANGAQAWAIIGNADATNSRLNEHFLTLSIARGNRWFALARYHDPDFLERGPEMLAHFLDMQVDDVFPIHVDIREVVLGGPEALAFNLLKEPKEKLSRAEIIALAIP